MPLELAEFHGSPGAFHHADLLRDPAHSSRDARIVLSVPDRDAVVLGSSQSFDVVDADGAAVDGLEVVKRRSGGGAVLVERQNMVWFDVVVPASSSLFAEVPDDVSRSMVWLGESIAEALSGLGVNGTAVHEGPLVRTPLSQLVCFAGLGPGEVLRGGDKLVGISQRRQREGLRFQCLVHVSWRPERLLRALAAPAPTRADLPKVAAVDAEVATSLPGRLAAALSPT